ncbi:MAG: PilZ domain-containing protein [Nitrospirota bacterium]
MEELRKHPRMQVHFAISFAGMQTEGKGTVTDLSLGGCGVECDRSMPKGTRLSLSISAPDEPTPIQVAIGVVQWSLGRRFGLQFLSLSDAARARIQRLVQHPS